MYDEYTEQGIDGLNEKIMEIVDSIKGDQSEVEVLDRIIQQTKLLFTTYKVRDLFKNDLEYCSVPVVDPATGKVREDMESLANRISVVRIQSVSDMDQTHTIVLLNVAINDEKTYEIMTVFDRIIECVDKDGEVLSESDLETLEEEPEERDHIQYLIRMGEVGKELKNVVTFEFTHKDLCDDCDCHSCCGHCDDCHCGEKEEAKEEECEDDDDFDDDEEDCEEEIIKLDFDMDLMDQFTKDCNVSLPSEDLLYYLVSMEFISFCFLFFVVIPLQCNGKKNGRSMIVWLISLMRFVILELKTKSTLFVFNKH